MKWFRDPRSREEDRQLFRSGESMLKEVDMESFLATLREERAFQADLRQRVLAYLKFLENGGQAYRDRRLQEKAGELVSALRAVKAHTAGHFLAFPRNQEGPEARYYLHPDYFVLEITNVSIEEHRFYLKTEQDLLRMAGRTSAAYRDFRALARKRLEP